MYLILPGQALSYENAIMGSLTFETTRSDDQIDAQADWARQLVAMFADYRALKGNEINARKKIAGLEAVDVSDNPDFMEIVVMQIAQQRVKIEAAINGIAALESEMNDVIAPLGFIISGDPMAAGHFDDFVESGGDLNGNDTV